MRPLTTFVVQNAKAIPHNHHCPSYCVVVVVEICCALDVLRIDDRVEESVPLATRCWFTSAIYPTHIGAAKLVPQSRYWAVKAKVKSAGYDSPAGRGLCMRMVSSRWVL